MMAATQHRIMVASIPSFCHLWYVNNPTIVCTRCQIVGHRPGKCKAKLVCTFCPKEHLTTEHLCLILSCRKKRSACSQVQRICLLCKLVEHFTGYQECAALEEALSSPPVLGSATPVVADHTSVVGICDSSRGCLRREAAGRPGTPVAPLMVNNSVSSRGLTKVMKRSEVNHNPARHNTEVMVSRLDNVEIPLYFLCAFHNTTVYSFT